MLSLSQLGRVAALIRAVGVIPALTILAHRRLGSGKLMTVRVGRAGRSFQLRTSDSDFMVMGQIFGDCEYEAPRAVVDGLNRRIDELVAEGKAPVVIDGGANVGYSSVYFAQQFPQAIILAAEPDPETFQFLAAHAEGHRIRPFEAAIWSDDDGVDLGSSPKGSWATQVGRGAGATRSMRLETLMGTVPGAVVVLLKLDVEGAEREICDASPGVVRSAPCIMIEPHDFLMPGNRSLQPLYAAIAGLERDTLLKGENLILYDPSLLSDAAPN